MSTQNPHQNPWQSHAESHEPMTATPQTPGPIIRLLVTPLKKADFIATQVVLALVALGAALSMVLMVWPFDEITFTAGVQHPGPAHTPPGQASNARATFTDQVVWTITDPSIGQRILVALPGLWAAAMVLVVALMLRSLVAAVQRGQTFSPDMLTRLRTIALVVLFGGITWPFITMGTRFALVAQAQADPVALFTFNLLELVWPFAVGMVLLVLVEIFGRAVSLADDVEGLV